VLKNVFHCLKDDVNFVEGLNGLDKEVPWVWFLQRVSVTPHVLHLNQFVEIRSAKVDIVVQVQVLASVIGVDGVSSLQTLDKANMFAPSNVCQVVPVVYD